MSEITTMGIENENEDPREELSDSEKEVFDEIRSFLTESISKINKHVEENLSILTEKVTEDMQKAAEEQKPDDELMLIQDEHIRKVTSLVFNANNKIVDLMVDIGIFTREEALEKLGEVEGVEGLEDYPKASWIIAHKQDEDGWFANWLPRNPGFFESTLNGEWPEWLSPPPSDLGE